MKRILEDFILRVWQHKGVISTLLLPLSWLYAVIVAKDKARQLSQSWRAPVPVIVVGNIIVGGTGKTPVTTELYKELSALGWKVGIISRGYGAKITGEAHVSDIRKDSQYLGDEPALLHAQTGAPVAAHPQRIKAAQQILKSYPEINLLISDDGLQHLRLARDIEIIVQDERITGNGRLIPAGPLREPASKTSLVEYIINNVKELDKPASHATTIETTTANKKPAKPTGLSTRQIFMTMQFDTVNNLYTGEQYNWAEWLYIFSHQNVSAIAGIGQPDRFFGMLKAYGLQLKTCIALPDHQAITEADIRKLGSDLILMTAKDAIKANTLANDRLWVVNARAKFSDPSWINDLSTRLKSTNYHR